MSARSRVGSVVDTLLDRTVVLGFGSTGAAVRRRLGGPVWPADPAPDALVGERVLVTGATSGIGEAMGRSFADLGASVHLLGRNTDKLAGVAAELRRAVPNAEVVEEVCDVGDLDAVTAWADDFAARVPALHGLVHNAGTMTAEREESAQGHELSLAVHVLGPHLMTSRLRERLVAGPASVVWVSSGGMLGAGLASDPDAIESRRGAFNGVQAYARTKRMQVVLADAWAHELDATGVRVESMHPGWAATPGVTSHLPAFARITGPVLRDAREGADTAVWLVATRPESHSPHFWHDRAQRTTTLGWQRPEDPDAVRRLLTYVTGATGTAPFRALAGSTA
ncbi:SDR family NAD(P)-dependent oxidoreductase [Nocardioides sp. YIM 123512]|uniref:SDR family NAD(P)-dependent oxidoreductase n=1 Tax=Nocardioides flavescens TaxID=2691959 RepID=A0A6L7F1Y4_9ACTN|nr:SDR family NAD(P)-dependent oxidoreductase [Nocardioides flavescens]